MHRENKNLGLFVQQLAQPKTIAASFFGFIVIMVLVNVVFKQDFIYLTQTFNYTTESAYELLTDICGAGRISHLLVFIPDIFIVVLYTALLVGANYAIISKMTVNCLAISITAFLPLVLTITQLFEIAVLAVVILRYPVQMPSLIQFANIVTMTKTVLTVLLFSTPVLGLLVLGIKAIVRRVP